MVLWAVVASIAVGLLLGGLAAAFGTRISNSPVFTWLTDSAATQLQRADEGAIARRDRAAVKIRALDGVLDVTGTGSDPHSAYGSRVVSMAVTMSAHADAQQVAEVLDAALFANLDIKDEDDWLRNLPVVTTLTTGNVRFAWPGGADVQAAAILALRDDPQISSANITLVSIKWPPSGSGLVTVAGGADVQRVTSRWEPRLKSSFALVDEWQFEPES